LYFLKDTICREQGHLFRKRLGNERLVKRVSVMIRQPTANARRSVISAVLGI